MVRAKNPESFEKKLLTYLEIFRISYVASMPSTDCRIPIVGVNIRYSFTNYLTLEQAAAELLTAKLVIQLIQIVAEDVFIWAGNHSRVWSFQSNRKSH